MIEIFKILDWVVGIVNFVVAFIVLFKGKQRIIKWLFFALIVVLNGWLITNYLSYLAPNNYNFALTNGRLAFTFGGLIAPLFIFFVLYFPYKSRFKIWQMFLLMIPTIAITIMSFGAYFAKDQILISNKFAVPVYGDYQVLFAVYILFYVGYSYLLLVQKYRKSIAIEKSKLLYIVIGFGPAILIGFIADILMPLINKNHPNFWGPLGTIFISLSFAYSILRFRLMDIKVVIRKGIAHFMSLAIILFAYIYLLIFSQKYFIKQYGWNEQTTTILLVLIIVLTIEPLRRFLFKIVDKSFFLNVKDEQAEAAKLQVTLHSSMQFDQLIKKITNELKGNLMVEEIQFVWLNRQSGNIENYYENERHVACGSTDVFTQYLKGHEEILVTEELPYLIEEQENGEREILQKVEKKLKSWGVSLVLPVGERGELVGAFLFGKRKNKEAYTSESVSYLHSLQAPITNAVANALLYKQAVERIATFQR